MPLPSLAKTWQYDVNNRVFGDNAGRTDNEDFGDDQRTLFYGIKEAMKSFALNPWVVEGSSDFVASNMTGTDLITDPITDLRLSQKGSAQAHSWLVLSQAAVGGSGLHVLFNHEGANGVDGASFDVYISEVGFGTANGGTDGSITARPTATDEVLLNNGNTFGIEGCWGSGSTAPAARDYVFHVWQSTDGQCTRVVILYNRQPVGFWIFDTVQNPIVGWGEKFIAAVLQENDTNTAFAPNYVVLNTSATARLRSIRAGLGNVRLYATGEEFASQQLGQHTLLILPNVLNREVHMPPMGLASIDASFRGRHGNIFDLWWGGEHTFGDRDGRTFPQDGSRQFVQFGHVVFPWDGSNPLVR